MRLRHLVLLAIRLYQRHLSPRKGFCCAYRVHKGRASCSALGYRVVRRHGVWRGLALIRARTRRCGEVHRRHRFALAPRWPAAQRGECDADCVPCDGDACSHALDVADCCSGCDGPSRRQRQPGERRRPCDVCGCG